MDHRDLCEQTQTYRGITPNMTNPKNKQITPQRRRRSRGLGVLPDAAGNMSSGSSQPPSSIPTPEAQMTILKAKSFEPWAKYIAQALPRHKYLFVAYGLS
jgi:hypothetical protein